MFISASMMKSHISSILNYPCVCACVCVCLCVYSAKSARAWNILNQLKLNFEQNIHASMDRHTHNFACICEHEAGSLAENLVEQCSQVPAKTKRVLICWTHRIWCEGITGEKLSWGVLRRVNGSCVWCITLQKKTRLRDESACPRNSRTSIHASQPENIFQSNATRVLRKQPSTIYTT